MGLDQYGYVVSQHSDNTDFNYHWNTDEYRKSGAPQSEIDANVKRIATWRKHPNLQGWMEDLFTRKAVVQAYASIREKAVGLSFMVTNVDGTTETTMPEGLNKVLEQIATQMAENNISLSTFNCQPIRLNTGDLDQLEMHIKLNTLPKTEGFFFGDDSDDYYKEYDLEFIKEARNAIRDGFDVYYDSWW
jgi:hypothetical protein